MGQAEIPLYANDAERKQHSTAIRLLCIEMERPEEVIRPLYEEILLEMKRQARITDYLSILVCRTIRDLARGYEGSSYLRLDDVHVRYFRSTIHDVIHGSAVGAGSGY
ncbi:MAG: DUF3562 domain-containing protein [Thermodesulfobacteriota bacterium]